MNTPMTEYQRPSSGKRRRWLVAVDPIFEAGRQGTSAHRWDVEDELVAVAILGDVTIDLSHNKSAPQQVVINAYAIFRDVDVLVAADTHVELYGGVFKGDLRNDVPAPAQSAPDRMVRIHGHSVFGDVTVRVAN
jgi:predicted membrane protein